MKNLDYSHISLHRLTSKAVSRGRGFYDKFHTIRNVTIGNLNFKRK